MRRKATLEKPKSARSKSFLSVVAKPQIYAIYAKYSIFQIYPIVKKRTSSIYGLIICKLIIFIN